MSNSSNSSRLFIDLISDISKNITENKTKKMPKNWVAKIREDNNGIPPNSYVDVYVNGDTTTSSIRVKNKSTDTLNSGEEVYLHSPSGSLSDSVVLYTKNGTFYGGGGTAQDASTLNGFPGLYYLDFNNFTNKPSPTITLGGDATGGVTLNSLGSGTLNIVVKDDSHNHIIGNVDGLQAVLDGKANTTHNHDGIYEPTFVKNTAFNKDFGTIAGTVSEGNHSHNNLYYTESEVDTFLSSKVDDSRVLTDVPVGAVFTDTIYVHPTNHPPSIITQDSSNRFVTDVEKSTWNGKQDSLGFTPENVTNKGVSNGYAELDSTGKVPSGQLPSFVDDVLEYASISLFPSVGESGKIYIAIDVNKTYRWSGTIYVEISESLALGTTSTTAYRGDRGEIAYNYSQVGHLPLSGGTLTGSLNTGKVNINNPLNLSNLVNIGASFPQYIKFWKNESFGMSIGYNGLGSVVDNKIEILGNVDTPVIEFFNDGRITSNGNNVWHQGNDGASSGMYSQYANQLGTSRTIQLTGDVVGSVTTDLSGNASIATEVQDDSHNHIISNIDGLQTSLDSKSDTNHNHTLLSLSEKNYSSLDGRPLDDNFNTLPSLSDIDILDELLIYDVSTSSYRKTTKQTLLSDISGSDYVMIVKEEAFVATQGQTTFNLVQGNYTVGINRVDVYIWGSRQPKDSYVEATSSSIQFIHGLDEGDRVVIKYMQLSNVMDYIHASNHASGGSDPLTPAMIGLGNVDNTSDATKNVLSATRLTTARTINGVSFNGTSNITIVDSTKEPAFTKNTAFNKNFGSVSADVKSNGIQSVGLVDAVARIDHIHPTDTTRQSVITGGASTITSSNLATNRALISNSSGKVGVASTTLTELGYVSGVTSSIQTQLNSKEPEFTKNSAFNKNFGTTSDTVCQGNDSRLSDARTPLAHTHTISNITGLQTALDGKVDDSQVLTNVPSGAVFTDTVYTHPTYSGDDFSVDTGVLTGAVVVSDIDINVTTDALGHVTDANGVVSTRTLTLADLGYTGATNANNYTHPANHPPSIITQDSSNRFVTDAEKSIWNGKSNLALGETSSTAYRGDRGKAAYDYSQVGHLPLTGGTLSGNLTIVNNTISPDEITFDGATSVGARISNANGYVSITPLNTGWAHLYTDRSNFIFNRRVYIIGGSLSTYSTADMFLQTNGTTRMQISNSTGVSDFKATPTVNGTAVTLVGHSHNDLYYTETEVDNSLALKANLASPSLTGSPSISQPMTDGTISAFSNPHLALKPTNTVDNTGFVGMTFGTSTSANYGFSFGALRSSNGNGSLVARFHSNSAQGTNVLSLSPTGTLTATLFSGSFSGTATLTGTPTAPTAASGTNTTQIATTAFVSNAMSSAGLGDMLKSVYDTNNDGIVNSAHTLNGLTATIAELNYTDGVTSNIQTQLNGKLGSGENAVSATKLLTARTINGVPFDGTSNITVADSTKLPTSGGTISGVLTVNNEIRMQEKHYINRRFEMDAVENNNTVYLLLCGNSGNNDVNGSITMDRTSGLRHACKADIIVSAGSSASPVGTVLSHGVAGASAPSYELVSCIHGGVNHIALKIVNPDNYLETSGAYFSGRISDTTGKALTPVLGTSLSSISPFSVNASHQIDGVNISVEGHSHNINTWQDLVNL